MFEGWTSPFAAEEQKARDRAAAWDAMKNDPGTAALLAGLSMLANNNGRNSFGQLVGRAGLDTLAGVGSMEAQRRAQDLFRREQAGGILPAGEAAFSRKKAAVSALSQEEKPGPGKKGLAVPSEEKAASEARESAVKGAGRFAPQLSPSAPLPHQPAFHRAEGEAADKEEGRAAKGAFSRSVDAPHAEGPGRGEELRESLSRALIGIGVPQGRLDSPGFGKAEKEEAFRAMAARALLDALIAQKAPAVSGERKA